METNKFLQDKIKVIEGLSKIQKNSSDNYNKAQEDLSNGLFTAATAYVAIILAFANNVHDFFENYSWVIVASVFSFSISLIPWIIEKISTSVAYGKNTAVSSKLADIAANEIWDEKSLVVVDKMSTKLLCGGKTSLIPIVMQIILFSIGVLFAVIAIAIVLL